MDAKAQILKFAMTQRLSEANIDTAHRQFAVASGLSISAADFADAIAECLRQRLIREPIRLPEGALQCHWQLDLTPAGVDAARLAETEKA